jgi:hypothetical protein
MTKFCPFCGKPIADDITKVCSSCGKDISTVSAGSTVQASTSMDRQEIFNRVIPFFASRTYAVQTQTDYVISFESQNRDISWVIFLVFCCLGLVPAIVYYYWFTHTHQVTVSLSGPTDTKVICIGNTEQARKDAAEFMRTLQ